MLAPCQWGWGDGEEGGYVAGSWGGQMLWGVELFGGLYGAKVEFDVTLVSWVNNRQTNLQQLHI